MDYLNDEQLVDLAQRLVRLTASGALSWDSYGNDEVNKFQFKTTVGDAIFSIRSKDKDDLAPHVLTIYQRQSGKAERLQDADSYYEEADLGDLLSNLYSDVKKKVLNLDAVAEQIFSALDSLEAATAAEPPQASDAAS